jgi:hypothetical protein
METVHSIDEEISAIRHESSMRIRRLQSRRNALVPLLRLPTEILLRIVEMLVHYTCTFYSPVKRLEEKWRAFMGACTHMRFLILDSPRFWAHIDLSRSVNWIELCMQRAQTSSVTVFFDDCVIPGLDGECDGCSDCDSNEEGMTCERNIDDEVASAIYSRRLSSITQLAQEILPRATRAEILVSRHPDFRFIIDDVIRLPLPRLHALAYIADGIDPADKDEDIPNSRDILRGSPALVDLVLHEANVSVAGLRLPALTRLELKYVSILEGPEHMFHLLETASNLQHLDLFVWSYESYEHHGSHLHLRPIHLPHLHTVHLNVPLPVYISHLRVLPAPSTELTVNAERITPSKLAKLFDHVWTLLDLRQIVHATLHRYFEAHNLGMTFSHPGIRTGKVTHIWQSGCRNAQPTLARLKAIRVTSSPNEYPLQLFEAAAQDPLHHLCSVDVVVMNSACDPWAHAQTSLCAWLRARVLVGRRISQVDLRGCGLQSICGLGTQEAKRLERIAAELRIEGLADEVLVEGEITVQA